MENGARPLMPCPICHKPAIKEYIPFCSKRCEQVDLGKWLTERYTIPVVEMDDEDQALPGEGEE